MFDGKIQESKPVMGYSPELKLYLRATHVCASLRSGWSAPSAIGIAGLGGGFEIGVEVSVPIHSLTLFFI